MNIPFHRTCCVALLAALGGTGACASGGSGGGSKTDWLGCTADADCPGTDRCVKNRCVSLASVALEGAGGSAAGGASGSGGQTATGGRGGAVGAGGIDAAVSPGTGGTPNAGGTTADAGDVAAGGATDSATASGGARNDAASMPFDAGTDARSVVDSGGVMTGSSCIGLPADCGPHADESCCERPLVTGGTFFREYDGVSSAYSTKGATATLSDFRLDRFEITVGRFRNFVAAWDAGYRPPAGAGKHAHLRGGLGLVMSGGGYEAGWDPSWEALTQSNVDWHAMLGAADGGRTKETEPVNPINWYASYAFCIWDGGFLPTDSELNYAASGGSEQRVYPWSNPPTSTAIDCSYANYSAFDPARPPYGYCGGNGYGGLLPVGSMSPKGDGKYGQADLGGNVWEWDLDWENPNVMTCVDCTSTKLGSTGWAEYKIFRSGASDRDSNLILSSSHEADLPTKNEYSGGSGARCAYGP
jgi:formylglycine-generating enzyme required for sulfatase activity